ncbi:hypothetical protein A6E00_08000 [Vibrio diabolicus]|nr:hypothetical protein A6E00_08000 [Vibrio diabolicus]
MLWADRIVVTKHVFGIGFSRFQNQVKDILKTGQGEFVRTYLSYITVLAIFYPYFEILPPIRGKASFTPDRG